MRERLCDQFDRDIESSVFVLQKAGPPTHTLLVHEDAYARACHRQGMKEVESIVKNQDSI